MTIGIINLTVAQPVVSMVFQEVFEDLTIVLVLDEKTNGVVVELLRANVSLEFLSHFVN